MGVLRGCCKGVIKGGEGGERRDASQVQDV
jgi:hypothetical protein